MGSIPTIGCVDTQQKYNLLKKNLTLLGRLLIAYSGGVDSTFLLKAAVDTLGPDKVLAVIGISPSLAETQYKRAVECAELIGADLRRIDIQELSDPQYSANSADRCFHCKSHLYKLLCDIAKKENYPAIACGSNLDDADDYRPGQKAAELFGIHSPLMEAKLTKQDIRAISRKLNLPTADIPASPCLASRIAYGLEITEDRLRQVEQAEDFLRTLGLKELRVRHHGQLARIEIPAKDFEIVAAPKNRSAIAEKLKSLGFKYTTIDLTPFKSGSLNKMLKNKT